MDVGNLLAAASAAQAKGDLDESSRLSRTVLSADPGNIQAKLLLGVAEAKTGNPISAVDLLGEVREADPTSFHAPFWLAFAYKRLGRFVEAVDAAEEAVAKKPNDAQALAQLGQCLMEVRLLERAEECLRTAQRHAPAALPIQFSLSQCLHMQGRPAEATEVLERALSAAPPSVDAVLKLGQFLQSQNYAAGAVTCARRALQLAPSNQVAELMLARGLLEDNRSVEAEAVLARYTNVFGQDPQGLSMLGNAYQALGRIQDAANCFQREIDRNPNEAYPYFALVNNRKVTGDQRPLVTKMEQLATQSLPPKQVSFLQYGLGKAHEDLGEYAEAMKAYDAANDIERRLKFQDRAFDEAAYAASFDRTIEQFSRRFLDENRKHGSSSQVPIFVVGMMRSGTTLVEQILSCHPEVGAAGELDFWPNNWRAAFGSDQSDWNPSRLQKVAARYVKILETVAPNQKHGVDKMPVNYAGLGIIHLAFPQAKIIHTRRNPIDTCLSIYVTPNRAATEYAHDKKNIAFAYRQYQRVMDHWRDVLPEGTMLDVDYESLVTDGERVSREVVDFCGLPWNDACLRPHDNPRTVVTPSVWQVRQPIYRTAMQRWKKFEPWLGPFMELSPIT